MFVNLHGNHIEKLKNKCCKEELNPRDVKIDLAYELVERFHGKTKAKKAKSNFISRFKNKNPYKKEFILNVFFSVLYAFFSAVAFLSLMPMLEVLFNGSKKITVK